MREAGVRLIAQHGYEAMSLRMLAKEIGIQAGSLYNYIDNKQDFLFDLLTSIIRDLTSELNERLEGVDDPRERLRIFIREHITFHTLRKEEVFIGNMELRSLTPENYAVVRKMRVDYESILADILEAGAKARYFKCKDIHVAKLAIFAMLTGVSSWYRPKGKYKIDALIDLYIGYTFSLLKAAKAD